MNLTHTKKRFIRKSNPTYPRSQKEESAKKRAMAENWKKKAILNK